MGLAQAAIAQALGLPNEVSKENLQSQLKG